MGHQIIRQPDGKLAVFSTGTDTIIVWDATGEEIVEWFAERAADEARRHVRTLVGYVEAGTPGRAYFQFVLSWDRALEQDREHGGDAWKQFADADLQAQHGLDAP